MVFEKSINIAGDPKCNQGDSDWTFIKNKMNKLKYHSCLILCANLMSVNIYTFTTFAILHLRMPEMYVFTIYV